MGMYFLEFHADPVSKSLVESGPASSERAVSSEKTEFEVISEPLYTARRLAGSQRPMLSQ